MLEISLDDARMAPVYADRISMPIRVSAILGASLVLWSAILIPFLV